MNSQYITKIKNFIPTIGHLRKDTLITKNTELIQVIRIRAEDAKDVDNGYILNNLKKDIKNALLEILDEKCSFWIHTIFQKSNYAKEISHDSILIEKIHNLWIKQHNFHNHYVNEIYISIVLKNEDKIINNIKNFFKFKSTKVKQELYFSGVIKYLGILDKISKFLLEKLKKYSPYKLSVSQNPESEIYSSELLSFYAEIIEAQKSKIVLDDTDSSKKIERNQYYFGNNILEMLKEGKKKFFSIISLKEYFNLDEKIINLILRMGLKIMITEILYVDQVDSELSKKNLKHNAYLLGIDEEEDISKIFGLDRIFDETKGSKKFNKNNELVTQQLTLTLSSDSLKIHKQELQILSNTLARSSLSHVFEDVNLESIFWSHLPGNFSFIKRKYLNVQDDIAIFASIASFGVKNYHDYNWEEPISLFRTEENLIYFFHFQNYHGNSNNIIMGPRSSGKTFLLNLLILEAEKTVQNILYITNNKDSNVFFSLLNFSKIENFDGIFNPFLSIDKSQQEEFLKKFFQIIAQKYKENLSEEENKIINFFVEYSLSLPKNKRILSEIIEYFMLNATNTELEQDFIEKLAPFSKTGKYNKIFESQNNNMFAQEKLLFSLESFNEEYFIYQQTYLEKQSKDVIKREINIIRSINAALLYSIYHVFSYEKKDIKKRILAIDNIGKIIYLPIYQHLLDELKSSDTVLLVTLNPNKLIEDFSITEDIKILESFETKILLPFNFDIRLLSQVLNISEKMLIRLKSLKTVDHKFLVTQNKQEFILNFIFNLEKYPESILSSDEQERKLFYSIKQQNFSDKSSDLFESFCKKLSQLD